MNVFKKIYCRAYQEGFRVAILNYSSGTNLWGGDMDGAVISFISEEKILADVARAREAGADMIVACAGSARMIGPAHVRPETVLIDVGINADGDGICGDADYERISGIVSVITPVPGGVGSVTTSVLLKHVVESAERSAD